MKTIELLQSLSDAQVDYVLVGGLAVQLHGFMRSTFDIDLVLAMNDENLARFIEVARRWGLTPGIPVPIASIGDLLVMKRAANRPKDRLDIEALEKIKRGEDPNA
jgi:hypothetical protein